MKLKLLILGMAVVILLGTGLALLKILDKSTAQTKIINSFEECMKAGYPILESFPRQCRTPDGRTFVSQEDIEQQRGLINANLDTEFQLKVDQKAVIKSENIEIKFLDVVEDSRCPSDVVCIWAGQTTVAVSVLKSGKNLGNFNLTIGTSENLNAKTFNGYSIKLIKLEPYPKSTQKIALSDYAATLIVNKSNI